MLESDGECNVHGRKEACPMKGICGEIPILEVCRLVGGESVEVAEDGTWICL